MSSQQMIGRATYIADSIEMKLQKHYADLAVPAYVMKQLIKYSHVAPLKPQRCSHAPNPIKYDKDNQSPSPLDKNPCLDKVNKKCIQQIVGSFLYYARAVDPTKLMVLSKIALQQVALSYI
jgi:hypothetical protein